MIDAWGKCERAEHEARLIIKELKGRRERRGIRENNEELLRDISPRIEEFEYEEKQKYDQYPSNKRMRNR